MKNSKSLVALVGAVVVAFGVSAVAPKVHAEDKKPAEKKEVAAAAAPAAPAAAPAAPAAAAPAAAEKKAAKAEKKEAAPKEMTVKGKVAKGKAEGSWVIKAGKKTYEVDSASPKAADLAGLDGKSVEAKGMVAGKMITVNEVMEMPAKAKKVAKAEAKPEEKKEEKK